MKSYLIWLHITQDKEVQVSSVEPPKTPLQLKTVSANSLRAPVVVRQTPPPNKTATAGTSVAGRDDYEQSTHEVMVGVTSGGGVVPSPPHSHFQSPEVISISDASPASVSRQLNNACVYNVYHLYSAILCVVFRRLWYMCCSCIGH